MLDAEITQVKAAFKSIEGIHPDHPIWHKLEAADVLGQLETLIGDMETANDPLSEAGDMSSPSERAEDEYVKRQMLNSYKPGRAA